MKVTTNRATVRNRVLLGSIEVLRKGEQVEIVQSTQKNYLIRKIGLDGVPFFEVFSICKESLTMIKPCRIKRMKK
jgi:hypothetical protein